MELHLGDCYQTLQNIAYDSVDMVYLDPPFFSQKEHALSDGTGKKYSFSDVWKSRDEYLEFLRKRLILCRHILRSTGTIFVHCDVNANAYIRLLMDEIFGSSHFRSEIIWTYKRWSNSQKGLLPAHQNILFFSKSDTYKFNPLFTDYSPTTNVDQILQDRIQDSHGKSAYKRDIYGMPICTNEKKGVPLSDVWEIPFLNPKAKERVGYPTQKPILLLERILAISTDEGDVVLDLFCGCGTTLVAAKLMNRRYIGIDINPEAIELTKKRLTHPVRTESALLRNGAASYDSKSKDEKDILSFFECDIVQRNRGIDAILRKRVHGGTVTIRIQKKGECLEDAIQSLRNASQKKNCSMMILIRTNPMQGFMEPDIPFNMLIIPSYELSLELGMKQLEWERT